MPSMAGSKGGISNDTKKQLMMLRKPLVQKPESQSRSQNDRPDKIVPKEQCDE